MKPLAATASTHRCGEAVIGGRADSFPPHQVKSPCIPGPSQFVALFLRHKMPWIFLTNRLGLTSTLMECTAD
jgi:hypothetical protein